MIRKYFSENLNPYQREKENVTCQFYINIGEYPIFHSHEDYWEFCVVTDGILDDHLNGSLRSHAADTLFYCTTKDRHYLTTRDKTPVRYVNFTIAESTLFRVLTPFSPRLKEMLFENGRDFSLPSTMIFEMEKTLHKLNLMPQTQYIAANDLLLAQILDFVQYIVHQLHASIQHDEPQWQQKLDELMQQEDALTYTVEDLCKKLNYSRVQLNRLFKAAFATTPHDYLLSKRLLYARNLLLNTDMSTLKIAYIIGYSNLAQFNAVFKSKFGVTPGQYRK